MACARKGAHKWNRHSSPRPQDCCSNHRSFPLVRSKSYLLPLCTCTVALRLFLHMGSSILVACMCSVDQLLALLPELLHAIFVKMASFHMGTTGYGAVLVQSCICSLISYVVPNHVLSNSSCLCFGKGSALAKTLLLFKTLPCSIQSQSEIFTLNIQTSNLAKWESSSLLLSP